MASENDKSISGRKIFFVNPSNTVQRTVIEHLRTMEYETYIITDYRMAKNALLVNKDSICYFCIDDMLSREAWHILIKGITQNTESFIGIEVGIISDSIPENKKEEFLRDINVTAGFFTTMSSDTLLREIVKSLDKLEARGMRKHIRLNCMNDDHAELFWITKDKKMFRLKILDVSKAGIAAKIPASQANAVAVNQLVSDAQVLLTAGATPISMSLKISAVKAATDFLLVVLMVTIDTPKDSLDRIQEHITHTLQQDFLYEMRGYALDKFNYELAARESNSSAAQK